MSRTNALISCGTGLGVAITLLGVCLMQSPSTPPGTMVGCAVVIAGFLTMAASIFRVPYPAPPAAPESRQDCRHVAIMTEPPATGVVDLWRLTAGFLAWCDNLDPQAELWPSFDRWLRDALHETLRARRVRNFHVIEGQNRITPMTGALEDPLWLAAPIRGLIEHVIVSGRRYVRGAPDNGQLIQCLAGQLAGTEGNSHLPIPDCLLPIQAWGKVNGIIAVGEMPPGVLHDHDLLQEVSSLLNVFWRHVQQWEAMTLASRTDRLSGVLNRIDLATQAEAVLKDSQRAGEPLVVLALAVEGVRGLDDQGLWELRNWLVQQIGLEMHRRLRSDDLIGRFSDDRFIAVLRRLDVGLGELIAHKLLAAVKKAIDEKPVVETGIRLRCGLAGAGEGSLELLLCRAFEALQAARTEDREVVVAPMEVLRPGLHKELMA